MYQKKLKDVNTFLLDNISPDISATNLIGNKAVLSAHELVTAVKSIPLEAAETQVNVVTSESQPYKSI